MLKTEVGYTLMQAQSAGLRAMKVTSIASELELTYRGLEGDV